MAKQAKQWTFDVFVRGEDGVEQAGVLTVRPGSGHAVLVEKPNGDLGSGYNYYGVFTSATGQRTELAIPREMVERLRVSTSGGPA